MTRRDQIKTLRQIATLAENVRGEYQPEDDYWYMLGSIIANAEDCAGGLESQERIAGLDAALAGMLTHSRRTK